MDGVEEKAEGAGLSYPLGEPPPAGDVREIAPGVYWVRMPLPFAVKWINLWLLEDGDGWTLVDTGIGVEQTREYWRAIFARTLKGKPITRVICTHMHPDHLGLAGWICRKFDAPLHMTRLEYVVCRMLVADTGREAPQEGVNFFRAAGWDEDALDSYRVRFGGFGKAVSRLPDSFTRLSDGDVLYIGGREWRIITGCGHSPEHACLWSPEGGLFISGDQVLPRISSNVSVFPTEPDADPLADWMNSCRKLQAATPADVLTLPSHNEPFLGLHVRLSALLESHERSLERVLSRLKREPRRAVDLFVALFGRKIGGESLGLATGETLAHLNCLIKRGLARRERDANGVDFYVAT